MLFEPVEAHVPSAFLVKAAADPWELRDARELRRDVFCREQGVFEGDDGDELDERATTLVAVAFVAGTPDRVVGTVRINEHDDGVWFGSRLAVDAAFRRLSRIGTSLIRLAVCTARGRGARRFFAHVQSQNAALFERLHWRTLDSVMLHGRPHCFMEADLAHYPAVTQGAGFLVLAGRRDT